MDGVLALAPVAELLDESAEIPDLHRCCSRMVIWPTLRLVGVGIVSFVNARCLGQKLSHDVVLKFACFRWPE